MKDMSQVREWRRLQLDGRLIAPRMVAVGTLVDGPAGVKTTNPAGLQIGPARIVLNSRGGSTVRSRSEGSTR